MFHHWFPINYTTATSTNVATSLPNIYLFWKTKLDNFKFNFSEFQQLRNNYANYTFRCVFVIVTQWLRQQNFPFKNKIKLARPLDNYLIQTSVEGKVRFPPIQGKVGFPLKVFPPMDSHHKWNKQMYHTWKRLGKSLNTTPNVGYTDSITIPPNFILYWYFACFKFWRIWTIRYVFLV
jgi:hypothetical protein